MQRREPFFIPYNVCYTAEGRGRRGASDLPTRAPKGNKKGQGLRCWRRGLCGPL